MKLLVGLVLSLVLAMVLRLLSDWHLALCWLLVWNSFTLLIHAYDKLIAGTKRRRVPEAVLLTCTGLGGAVGGLLGVYAFRHKSSKRGYQVWLWIIACLQVAVAVALFSAFSGEGSSP